MGSLEKIVLISAGDPASIAPEITVKAIQCLLDDARLKPIVISNPDLIKNTKILVDGVAYMPHGIIDIDSYNIDYYVVSFYKFYGLRISAIYLTDECLKHVVNQNNMIFNSNQYDINPSKLQLGGINYETAISILGIRDYLLEFYSTYKKIDIKKIKFTRLLIKIN